MNSWTIYGKNGVAKAEVNELELHDEWMAECFLTVSVKSAEPIDFAVDDYIDYRGERYAIQYDPTLLKKSRRNSYGEGFSYDNIKFVNEAQAKIVRCDFNDIVLNDNELHYTSLPTFPFYCESVDDLLDRILANLEDLYPGEFTIIGLNTVRNKQRADITHNTRYVEEYKKWIDPTFTPNTEPYGKQGVAETVDNINCWNALAKVHEDFELNFIVRGYTIIVGTVGVFTANKFRYGKGNGLYEIERISDSEQQIVTRLRSYGASTNLPTRYYATLNTQVFGTVTQISANTTYASFLLDLNFSTKYFNYRSESYPGTNEFPNYIVRIMANNHTVKGYVTKDYTTGACSVYCESSNPQEDDRDEPDAAELVAFAQSLSVGTRVYFVNYVEKGAFDSAHTDYATENLPDNMAVSRLMLPGFPNQSLYDWAKAHRDENTPYDDTKGICTINGFTAAFSKDKYRPYIDSPNADDYGIRPASFYFDGSGDNEDIHPTIEGMTYNNQPIDVIYAADQVADNGVYAEGKSPDPIFITLPVLGFELDQVWKDDASIEMKDGMCGGRSLKIVSKPVKIDGGYWKCKVERVKDESLDLWFPYNDFQIHSDDHYVLVGIDMPDAYVTAASERLFYASLTALQENHAPRFTYQPRIDEVWMQRQHDKHLATPAITSLHDTLKSGDIFSFADTDLGIDANIIIDVLTIKENGNNGIPTYEITLRDEKQVSPIQKIQNKVDSLYSGSYNGNSGSGLSGRQIQSLIENEGNSYFLSKINDDEAQGNIGFLSGVWFGVRRWIIDKLGNAVLNTLELASLLKANEIQSSNYTGDGIADTGFRLTSDDNTGNSKLTVDNLYVRKKATFEELEVKKITAIAGNQIYSSAANVILRTDYFDGDGNEMGYSITKVPWLLKKVPFLLRGRFFGRLRKTRIFIEGDDIARIRKVRCYFLAKDEDREVYNLWKVQEFREGQPIEGTGNDFARCQTMNITNSHRPTYLRGMETKAGNIYWWRRLCGVSTEPVLLPDGREYHYFDVEFNYAEEERLRQQGKRCAWCDLSSGDIPAAGDNVVQFGNDMNTDRMNLIAVEVNGEDSPAHKWYRGIYTFDLNKCWWGGNPRKEMISAASGVEFYSSHFKVKTDYGVAKVPMDRPEVNWSDITTQRDDYSPYGLVRKLYYYDAITHSGSRWLCLASENQHWVRPQVWDDPAYAVTDSNGDYRHNGNWISNTDYSRLTEEQKEQCARVSDYTTAEPISSSGDWKQIVSKGDNGYTPQKGIDYFDGQNGKDGWMVSADPANVIITQNISNSSSFTSSTVSFSAKKGNVSASLVSVGTPSSSTFNVSKSGNNVLVSSPKTHDNQYYNQGSFSVQVIFRDPDSWSNIAFTMTVLCYANLLGSWEETVVGDTKTEIARSTLFDLDENGNIVESGQLGEYIRSSTENTSKLTAITTGSGGNTVIKESQVTQYSDSITMSVRNGLSETGINIVDKKITLNAEKTIITGELSVPRVQNQNENMVTTCEAGVVRVESKSTSSYGVFTINSLGEVVLQMYDKDGKLVLNLGGTPNTAVNGRWRAVRMKRVDVNGFIAETRENFTATAQNTTMFYILELGTLENSGQTIQYFLPNGSQTTNQTVIARDNHYFVDDYNTEQTIANGTFIPDGYYVLQNDGIFPQDAPTQYEEDAKYFVMVKEFSSGVQVSIQAYHFD